ncbi:MAG TPA: antibiotic biosynthesis monooxygenase [Gammaproteobacteria bacterium]|nr:antibiotic biosynthesis monooxygenase [Gammaproteobacteria bacterium]
MFIVMNRIPVNPEFREDFEERFRNRAGLVEGAPGFIRNLVLRPVEDSSDCHVVMTLWESKAAFEAWTRSEAFARAHEKARHTPSEMYAGRNVLEMFEVVSDSGEDGTA